MIGPRRVLLLALLGLPFAAVGSPVPAQSLSSPPAAAPSARTPISNVVYLMQGERSFDHYFATFPGADGIPPDACQPVALDHPAGGCVTPFPAHGTVARPPSASRTVLAAQINKGRMNGFVSAFERQGRDGTVAMGYYDERDLPFAWAVARDYVLFDRFFAARPYGIRLNRSYWVAGAAPPGGGEKVPVSGYGDQATIFDRLEAAGVSWRFYVQDYDPAVTFRATSAREPVAQTARVPLLNYARFVDDPKLRGHIVDLDEYFRDLERGTLPAVSYIATSWASERAAQSIQSGQKLVRHLITQLMLSGQWSNSAFLWTYDGSGGWYDHVPPPVVDGESVGLRVPALLVSPFARRGHVDHTPLNPCGVLRFIERNWNLAPLARCDLATASLDSAFDFDAQPRSAHIISAGSTLPVPTRPVRANPAVVYAGYGGATIIAIVLVIGASRMATSRRNPIRVRPWWRR